MRIFHRLVEALSEICPQDVMEQMMMRRHEIGEKYENLKAKVVSFATNKAERARGGRCSEFGYLRVHVVFRVQVFRVLHVIDCLFFFFGLHGSEGLAQVGLA